MAKSQKGQQQTVKQLSIINQWWFWLIIGVSVVTCVGLIAFSNMKSNNNSTGKGDDTASQASENGHSEDTTVKCENGEKKNLYEGKYEIGKDIKPGEYLLETDSKNIIRAYGYSNKDEYEQIKKKEEYVGEKSSSNFYLYENTKRGVKFIDGEYWIIETGNAVATCNEE